MVIEIGNENEQKVISYSQLRKSKIYFAKKFQKIANYLFLTLCHSHKKRKDSLKTRAKRGVLRAYVENEAILEPILLCRASKYCQTKKSGY